MLCDLASTEALSGLHTGTVTLEGRNMPAAEAFAALRTKVTAAEHVARTVRHYVHPVGTARMGPVGDAYTVTDQCGRVHGVDHAEHPAS